MSEANKNFQDFEFIQQEIARMRGLTKEGLKNIDIKKDGFHTLPHPSGMGVMLIGRAAKVRFEEVAERGLKARAALAEKVSKAVIVETIEYFFCEEILKRQRELTPSLADKMVSRAFKHVESRKLKTLTQFFPCVLPLDDVTDKFSIGPVEFTRMDSFLKENAEACERYVEVKKAECIEVEVARGKCIDEKEEEKILEHVQKFPTELNDYYSKFPWVAAIKIENFEPERSREAAYICVYAALSILRLFLHPTHAERIQMAGQVAHEPKTAQLTKEGDQIDIWCTRDWLITDESDWVKKITTGTRGEWLQLAGSLLPYLYSDPPIPILYQRYVNAFWWYSEALTSKTAYLTVIALCNALEAFLGTSEGSGDTVSQISKRADLFLKISIPDEDWVKITKDFYDLRSDLVHGRIPAFDRRVHKQIGRGTKLVQDVLMQGLSWTQYLAHEEGVRDSLALIHQKYESDLEKFSLGALEWMTVRETDK